MSPTVALSLSGRTRQVLVGGLVVGFFLGPTVAALLAVAGLTVLQSFAATIVGGLALTLVWVWRRSGSDEDNGSAWDGIPEWQYDSRFAEAGGLTRSEQEAAIEDHREEE